MKPAKILYFVLGHAPTPEDFAAASEMKAQVVFRNANAVPTEEHALETCDGVAGHVPPIYAKTFPDAEKAIKAKAAELKALSAKVGDGPAPKSGQGKAQDAGKGKDAGQQAQAPAAAPQAAQNPPAWNPNPAQ